jgi:hypothetical protein
VAATDGHTGIELIESLSRWDLQGRTCYENIAVGGACVTVIAPLTTEAEVPLIHDVIA